MPALVTLAAMLAGSPALDPDNPPAPGRDHWVVRRTFKHRSRMLVPVPAKDPRIAFNQETRGVQGVWRADMRSRGTACVYSRDNRVAANDAQILAQAPSTIAAPPEKPHSVGLPAPWMFDRVAFVRTSLAGPFRVEVADAGGSARSVQHSDANMRGSSDAETTDKPASRCRCLPEFTRS